MRYVLILLMLTGCGSGYEISGRINAGECLKRKPSITLWECEYKPHFMFTPNITLAICESEKECRDVCDKARKNK